MDSYWSPDFEEKLASVLAELDCDQLLDLEESINSTFPIENLISSTKIILEAPETWKKWRTFQLLRRLKAAAMAHQSKVVGTP